ncbi:Protein fmp52, mitochondrial [Agyrium rufum]|nr:Protein fmp52, mitochondrial [Agyrium rufum]
MASCDCQMVRRQILIAEDPDCNSTIIETCAWLHLINEFGGNQINIFWHIIFITAFPSQFHPELQQVMAELHPSVSAAIVGCTGLLGSQILTTWLKLPSSPSIYAIARRALPTGYANLHPKISNDNKQWSGYLSSIQPRPSIFFSSLGTSVADAGSLAAQRAVDYDLNLELARTAKEAGVETYVLISSAGTSANSMLPYSRLKGELDQAVKEVGFKYTVILRPGLLVGRREKSRYAEGVLRFVARWMGSVSKSLTDFWAQDIDTIAKAAVSAALLCARGERPEGVWVVEQKNIIRLGRTEWKEGA